MDKDHTEYKINEINDNQDVLLDDHEPEETNQSNTIEPSIEEISNELKEKEDELKHYRKLYDDTYNKLKYCLADFDNFRKNMEKQNSAKILSVKADMLSAVINFREDFDRALDSINQQNLNSSVSQGLNNILKNMDMFLEKENVKAINALNKVFDPNMHEIIGFSYFEEGENEEKNDEINIKENIVTKEIRKGYLLNDKILRPSMVEVSKKIIKNTDNNKNIH